MSLISNIIKNYFAEDSSSPQEVEERFKKVTRKPKKIASLVAGVGLTLATIASSAYVVDASSNAVVTRFGKYNRTANSGLNFKIPIAERVTKVPIREVFTEEFGFRTLEAGVDSAYIGVEEASRWDRGVGTLTDIIKDSGYSLRGRSDQEIKNQLADLLRSEYLMLTGDLNMADVEWSVQYKIKDPVAYLFNVRNPKQLIRDASLHTMKMLTGDGSVDEAITIGRNEYQESAEKMLQEILDHYNSGIDIQQVMLQDSNVPIAVRPAFNQVNTAMQDKEKRINQAMQEYNAVIPKAKGRADFTIEEARGYALERINMAEGDVMNFNQQLAAYQNSPDITRTRMYLETMERILPQLGSLAIVEQKGAEGGVLVQLKTTGDLQ
ncbi:FtsH protease activity modulator HflK [Candidatus Woesearchaeota archaeon]|nr:FtsH protease activity modulator HflK [Candidatus Woesearchaeota archaeon]